MEVAITKMSSKGQVVIPLEMRGNIKEGDKLVIIQDKDRLIMKKATKLSENLKEDLEFARRTEEAWKRHDKGAFKRMDFEDFIIATKKIIREPLFNRIDYADIYTLAVEIAKNKTLRQNPSPVCLYNSIPEEVKEMAKKLGSRLATSCGETLGKGKNEKNI